MDTSTMIRVATIEGYDVFETNDGSNWVRDTDLARRAGLSNPRQVRRDSIETAIKDGAIVDAGSVRFAHATKLPKYRQVTEVSPRGDRGGTQESRAYYLDPIAALIVIQRMHTPMAVEMSRAMATITYEMSTGKLSNLGTDMQRALEGMKVELSKTNVKSDRALSFASDAIRTVEKFTKRIENVELKAQAVTRRLALTNGCKQDHCYDIWLMGKRCPCCGIREVVNEKAQRRRDAEYDHFYANSKSDENHTWLICKPCHDALSHGKVRRMDVEDEFKAYQSKRQRLPGRQSCLFN